jgi:predicted NAD/FAD-binding protein
VIDNDEEFGDAGLTTAWLLDEDHEVILFEARDSVGPRRQRRHQSRP